jgi:lipoate-protein ligase A
MTTYRMIPFRYFDAFTNMALDEAIMESIRTGQAPPTIRFYGWQPSAISIGIFQGIRNEVNLEETSASSVDVIRRQTGGGAVYHDTFGEVTYSILGPLTLFPINILKSYEVICADIVHALQSMGLAACFSPINDIIVGEQKISGNAQTRCNGVLLQHGTILFCVDVEKMFSLLNVSQEKISDKLIKSVKKRVTCITDLTSASMSDLNAALEAGFSRNRAIVYGDYTPQELERAQQLVKTKYRTEAWNYKL